LVFLKKNKTESSFKYIPPTGIQIQNDLYRIPYINCLIKQGRQVNLLGGVDGIIFFLFNGMALPLCSHKVLVFAINTILILPLPGHGCQHF
jgi:hypothetical protein